jgi:hypothetical protein
LQGKRFVIALFALLTLATVYLLSLVPRRGEGEGVDIAPVRGTLEVRLQDGTLAQDATIVVLPLASQLGAATIVCDARGRADVALVPGDYRAYRKDPGGAPAPPASTLVPFSWPRPSGILEIQLH